MHSAKDTCNSQDSTVRSAYKQLQDALEHINTNEGWLEYLAFQSKFYEYSLNNTLLIFSQNPEASYVAGYKKWMGLNRYVMKGEKSIKILAPVKYKVQDEQSEDTFRLKGFRLVSVFDISQTDGSDEYFPVLISGLKGSAEDEDDLYKVIKGSIDIPVDEIDQISSKGCYYLENPRIEIRSSLTMVQKIKTLCHEWSHHLHHTRYYEDESYALSEVIAESSAYIVCSCFGIDTSDYSAGYIHSWSKDQKVLHRTANKIQKIASEMISFINESPNNGAVPAL